MKGVFTQEWPYRIASRVTDGFPRLGARFLDSAVRASAGNVLVLARAQAGAERAFARAGRLDRILVVADLNIGDAVTLQAAVSALRDFLPTAHIDYAVSRLAGALVAGNPEATEVHPVLEPGGASGAGGIEAVARLTRARRYDLLLSFCPFFPAGALAPAGTPVIGPAALASRMLRDLADPTIVAHVAAEVHRFVHRLLARRLLPVRDRPFRGVSVWLSAEARERADTVVRRAAAAGEPLVLVNPDASSRFTRLPAPTQVALLRGLLRLSGSVVLAAGHTEPGLEERLLAALTAPERARIRVLPATMPLDAFAAVVDAARLVLTGDTGPLHVAAARKEPRDARAPGFRNRTAILSLFGATPSRLYGYDSQQPGFLPANQAAPCSVHAGASACRNLTCINKTAKSCRAVRCFDGLDAAAVLADAARVLRPAEDAVRPRARPAHG